MNATTGTTLSGRGSAKPRSVAGTVAPPGYVLEAIIGIGGMAVVHRARVIDNGRVVALKLMQEDAVDGSATARFRREALATSRLDHDNVVRVFAFDDSSAVPFMAAELVDGGSVRDLMTKAGRLPPLVALLLVDDLLCGLAHVHEHGLVHRDVKPANLLLTTTGHVKVSDFGIATASGEATLTRPGEVIGTPSYMSPEQALGLPLTPASDLFSVGTVLYELISGVNPFEHESQSLTLARVRAGQPTPIFELDPTVPGGVERLLQRLFEPDPALRCQSAAEALVMLRAARAELAPTSDSVVRGVVLAPQATVALVRAEQGAHDLAAAHTLIERSRGRFSNGLPSARAAFLAFRATTLAPDNVAARELLASLCARHGFSFGQAPSAALQALEAPMAEAPSDVEIVKRAAVTARKDGDLVRAAGLFKRYLRQRPGDDHARQQLASIVGDDVGINAAAHAEHARTRLHLQLNPASTLRAVTRTIKDHTPLAVAAAAFVPAAVLGYPIPAALGAFVAFCSAHIASRVRRSRSARHAKRTLPPLIVTTSTASTALARADAAPPALVAAVRALAIKVGSKPEDAILRVRLERAACSLALADRTLAIADLDTAIALMAPQDPRKQSAAHVVARLREI